MGEYVAEVRLSYIESASKRNSFVDRGRPNDADCGLWKAGSNARWCEEVPPRVEPSGFTQMWSFDIGLAAMVRSRCRLSR